MRIAAVAALLLAACASAPPPASEPGATPTAARGLSCESAIVIDAKNEDEGVRREMAWIRDNFPGARKDSQDLLVDCNGKGSHHDAVHITTANGQKVTIYFDISGWFGKF